MKSNQFHIDFRLNGNLFPSVEDLLVYSKTLSMATHHFLQEWFSISDTIQVKTSGSTGKPKIIQLKKEFMINSALSTGVFFELPEKTTALLCMSTDYIAGKMMLVRAVVLGWHLDIEDPVSNPLKRLKKQYDFSAMVPIQLQNSLSEIYKIKKLIVGGGIVSDELEKELKHISTDVFATFGMTETITHIAVKKLNHLKDASLNGEEGAFYKILPHVKISIDNRNCLVINAPKVSEEIVVTNDVVDITSGFEFRWLGRYDNVINSGGIKLHPEEIEKKLSQIIFQRFFVAGIPDSLLGEKLILVIEGKQTNFEFDKVKELTKYQIPKNVYFVAKFVDTATNKIQRFKTLDLLFK
jgi:O-succinylbenzoic acid--CoA ligase